MADEKVCGVAQPSLCMVEVDTKENTDKVKSKVETLENEMDSVESKLSNHTHSNIVKKEDTRSVATKPNDYVNEVDFLGLKYNTVIDSPFNNTYSYLVGLRGWGDSSGGKAHEIAFNDIGISVRSGSKESWDAWERVITSDNFDDYAATKNHTHNSATTSAAGLMSAADKTKLDGITSGANAYTLPSAGSSLGGVKSGGDVTISDGVITVNDDSHNHVISNVDGLQTALDSKSDTSHTHNYAGSSSAGGAANSANKLAIARTVSLSGGASGSVSFDGSEDKTLNVTSVKEAYLTWGGKNISGNVSALDMATSNVHSANRLAFANPNGITIEYSTDGGTTWTDYGATNGQKIALVSGIGNSFIIGKKSSGTVTVNDKLRITLNAQNMSVYTRPEKLLINVSTNGAGGSNVIVEYATVGAPTTFTKLGTYSVAGWSGWNSIPVSLGTFGGATSQTSNRNVIRLTLGITSVSSDNANRAQIIDLALFGQTYWTTPSTMAKTGHLYSYDVNKSATFPANVTAKTFIGALSGNASTATKLSTDKKIGEASFNNSENISAQSIFGYADCTGTNINLYENQYTKFATITLSGAWSSCMGDLIFTPSEADSFSGMLYYYLRNGNNNTTTTIKLRWQYLTKLDYIQSVVAVKVSDGVFDLYYKPVSDYDTMRIININCNSPNNISFVSNSGYVSSVTAASTSYLDSSVSYALKASQDSFSQNIADTYIKDLSVSGKTITYTKGDGDTGTITTQDTTYTHPTTAGNKHIPSGGSSGQILRWSADGTAVWGADNNSDTKNTAGSTNSSSKLFLVGATSQAANPQTYSHDTAYVGTDGCLYSNSTKVSVEGHTHSEYTYSGKWTYTIAESSNSLTTYMSTYNTFTLFEVPIGSVISGKVTVTAVDIETNTSQNSTCKIIYLKNDGTSSNVTFGSSLTVPSNTYKILLSLEATAYANLKVTYKLPTVSSIAKI